jgi:TRAP-type C4-dicarboxylate transport system permease small subunit
MSQTDCYASGCGLGLLDRMNRLFELLSMWCLVGFTVAVFVQMAARNMFNLGIAEFEEISRSLDISMVFLVIPILMREGQHIVVDLFLWGLPGKLDKAMKLLASAICIGFSALFLYSGYLYMMRHWNVPSPVLKMPNIVFFGPALIGMALFLLNCIVVFILILRKKGA